MIAFYNIIGGILCVIALFMFRYSRITDVHKPEMRRVGRTLYITYLLAGASLFAAQFEPHLTLGEFQMFSVLMIFFFYLIAHGFIYSALLLYHAPSTSDYLRKLRPTLALFGLYALADLFFTDAPIYTFDELLSRLPHDPMLWFRSLILGISIVSVIRGIRLCNRESRESDRRMAMSFSDDGFQRSTLISNYMWSLKTLALWAALTQCYTTPVLEVVSCCMITVVCLLQLLGFKKYSAPTSGPLVDLSTTEGELDFEVNQQDTELKRRLARWVEREDKPFIRSSLSIADVAKEIGVSKNRFSTYINSQDFNFRTWVNTLRIEEAKRLMTTRREMSISEVAEYTGFCDLPAFSRSFKKQTGVTPKTFRDEALNASN